ncbi:MAG: Pyridoxamine 5'-phosphate oxidase-related FMN-binding protein [Promethearchaeota archaeon]|nr:MAG: Pyridoxamine 5'-phosphate oxidase-related FMN-binding protein [Candidatus Lokiarchaeota archaeon]
MNELLKQKIGKMLEEQRFAVIATQGKTEPYTNLVSFFANKDLKKIYFPTSKNTRKFKNLSKHSRLSILIDNRDNEPVDIENAMTVTAVGETSVTENAEIIHLFLQKHPYLKEFTNSNDCRMIEIDIEKYSIVENFQEVKIIYL